jgi:very-short-patch-repair endonuclease
VRVRGWTLVDAMLASRRSPWDSCHVRQTRLATRRARELRRNMTDAEAKLWSRLRDGRLLGPIVWVDLRKRQRSG